MGNGGGGGGRDRSHGNEFPHAHGHSLGGPASRRGCARDGYDRDDPRLNRHASAHGRDPTHLEWRTTRGIGSLGPTAMIASSLEGEKRERYARSIRELFPLIEA
jgi:hypothetical protein